MLASLQHWLYTSDHQSHASDYTASYPSSAHTSMRLHDHASLIHLPIHLFIADGLFTLSPSRMLSSQRHCKPGHVSDVSEAIDTLCRHDIQPHLPRAATQNSNAFRQRCCYVESVDKALRKHMTTLRSLYAHYADLPDGSSTLSAFGLRAGAGLDSAELMSLGEWMVSVM